MLRPSKFSCAVPVGSWHDLLPATLASLAQQSEPLEVAFLDASNDPRVAKAADECGIDFVYRRTGPDAGQAAAIAEGWRETTGNILFWLNGDDQLTPSALTTVKRLFVETASDVVFGASSFIDARGNHIGHHEQVAEASQLLLRSNSISQPSCFAHRAAVEAVGGLRTDLHFVMDWDLWIRLYLAKFNFHMTDTVLSKVYMGEGTKTAMINMERYKEIFSLVQKHAGTWAALKSSISSMRETRKITLN